MNELIGNITDDALWPKICIRDDQNINENEKKNNLVDQEDIHGCIGKSFNNLT